MKRILIIRLSAIGDVVMASAILPALRNSHPNASIAWLVEPMAAPLLDHHPLLDKVIRWPRAEWLKLLKSWQLLKLAQAIISFVRMLRAEKFDTVLDVQGLLKSGIWAYVTGAPTRIGLRSLEGSHRLMTRVIQRGAPTFRIGADYLHFAATLGLDVRDFPMSIPVQADAQREATELLHKSGVNGGYIVLCPFTTRPQKHWFDHHWISFAQQASKALNLPLVILGGPSDLEHAMQICNKVPFVYNLAGQTTLAQTVAIVARASGLVGVDTGLTHLGIAHHIPSVGLFGSTRPYDNTGHNNATVLYDALPCSPCRRRPTCGGAYTCMEQLTPARALTALQTMMAVQ